MKKEYICLDFDTLAGKSSLRASNEPFWRDAEKDDFCKELGLMEEIRDVDLNDYERKYQEKRNQSNNPGQR